MKYKINKNLYMAENTLWCYSSDIQAIFANIMYNVVLNFHE